MAGLLRGQLRNFRWAIKTLIKELIQKKYATKLYRSNE